MQRNISGARVLNGKKNKEGEGDTLYNTKETVVTAG